MSASIEITRQHATLQQQQKGNTVTVRVEPTLQQQKGRSLGYLWTRGYGSREVEAILAIMLFVDTGLRLGRGGGYFKRVDRNNPAARDSVKTNGGVSCYLRTGGYD